MFLVMAEYTVSDIGQYAKEIGLYIVTVLVGLAIHFFVVLPLVLLLLAKRNPLPYYRALLPAMATAFGKFRDNLLSFRTLLRVFRMQLSSLRRDIWVASFNLNFTRVDNATPQGRPRPPLQFL